MNPVLPNGLTDCLLWSDELGYGWHPRQPMSYEGDYFAKYQALDATPMGAALTAARVELVAKYANPWAVVDIGIGGGRFVTESCCCGYDVSEEARAWLESRDSYIDPYCYPQSIDHATCWDSLEHIPNPEEFMATVKSWIFVSMPTYESAVECLASKHYKPGEHLHYFSINGFCQWADKQGFEVVEINHMETELGREGITTFVLRRYRG